MVIEKSVKDYIAQTASGEPTPGGGSVSALAGSLGAALTSMVNNLTVGKKAYEELPEDTKGKIKENFDEIEKVLEELNGIIDEDTHAFSKVMEAFKMPKETDEEKKARSQAIQDGYKIALEVPLRCSKKCLRVLELQDIFADYGNVHAITDVGVGTLLAYTGVEGSLFNVSINLGNIKDEAYKKEKEKEAADILKKAKELKEELLEVVYKRL